jgi:hypothetical protein
MLSIDAQTVGGSSHHDTFLVVTPSTPMDRESQGLLAPTPELLATVKVFPLIPSLKKDVIVSDQRCISPLGLLKVNV